MMCTGFTKRTTVKAVAVITALGASLALQGCGIPNPFKNGKKSFSSAGVSEDKGSSSPQRATAFADPQASCDALVRDKTAEFEQETKRIASVYYDGVVKQFGEDFVRYPFCLENSEYLVEVTRRKMQGQEQYKGMPIAQFEERLDENIQEEWKRREAMWEDNCKDWAERNKDHQIANLDMVRNVLKLDSTISDSELKAQIANFFNPGPWWQFFHAVEQTGTGCMRRYTDMCVQPSKAARRKAAQLVADVTKNATQTWHAFTDDPTEHKSASLLQHVVQQARERRPTNLVPIEVMAGGHQLRTRHNESSH